MTNNPSRKLIYVCAVGVTVIVGLATLFLTRGGESEGRVTRAYCSQLSSVLKNAPQTPGKEYYESLHIASKNLTKEAPSWMREYAEDYEKGVAEAVKLLAAVEYDIDKVDPEKLKNIQTSELSTAAGQLATSASKDCGKR